MSLIWTPSDKPPPKRSNRPHGSLLDCSHESNSPFLPLDGIINKAIATRIAIPASVRPIT